MMWAGTTLYLLNTTTRNAEKNAIKFSRKEIVLQPLTKSSVDYHEQMGQKEAPLLDHTNLFLFWPYSDN